MLKTVEVCQLLRVNYFRLAAALRAGKFSPPKKDCSGDFQWSEQDIAAARAALATDLRRKENRQGVRA